MKGKGEEGGQSARCIKCKFFIEYYHTASEDADLFSFVKITGNFPKPIPLLPATENNSVKEIGWIVLPFSRTVTPDYMKRTWPPPRHSSSEYDSEVLYFCGTVSSGTYWKSLRKRMEQRDDRRSHIKQNTVWPREREIAKVSKVSKHANTIER